jgi:hypothetical protein
MGKLYIRMKYNKSNAELSLCGGGKSGERKIFEVQLLGMISLVT